MEGVLSADSCMQPGLIGAVMTVAKVTLVAHDMEHKPTFALFSFLSFFCFLSFFGFAPAFCTSASGLALCRKGSVLTFSPNCSCHCMCIHSSITLSTQQAVQAAVPRSFWKQMAGICSHTKSCSNRNCDSHPLKHQGLMPSRRQEPQKHVDCIWRATSGNGAQGPLPSLSESMAFGLKGSNVSPKGFRE